MRTHPSRAPNSRQCARVEQPSVLRESAFGLRGRRLRVTAARCTPSKLSTPSSHLPTIFHRASIAANWKISRRGTLPIGDPASRLAYHPLRRAPRPAFDRVIFTAVTAVEWQA